MNWLLDLFRGIGGGVTAVVEGWQKRTTARAEAEVQVATARAQAEATILVAQATAATRLAENAQSNDAAWDMAVVGQMERSWKDEWFVLLVSIPLVLAFIDAPTVHAGFEALELMPDWYFYTVGTIIAATFGFRRLVHLFETIRRPGR